MEQYNVTGMSCAACSARVEKAVSAVPGVSSCSVSLLTNSMGVEGSASSAQIIKAVQDAGYGASLKNGKGKIDHSQEERALEDHETPLLRKRLISSIVFLLILMYFSMGHMMLGLPLPSWFEGNHTAMALVQMVLAAIVLVINQRFFISGARSLIHRAPNMDSLVALGSGVSFIWSVVVIFRMSRAQLLGDAALLESLMNELYFESAAMILTLITVGKMLEARSKGKTTDALKSLMKLSPRSAVIIRDGVETEVPIEEVRQGDIFIVRPGESIPVDGIVIEGTSAVNEAALTGESIPVDKGEGNQVSAATINQSGFIRCRATRVGEDTTLSQIIRMVSDAAETKAPIAKIADKVSGIFVPAVIVIALITTAVWLLLGRQFSFALARGISVLVISCPCALGLATPVAIMVGNGKGARNGILFKTAASLEETGRIRIIALDKTGTITSGEPRVTDVIPAAGYDEKSLLKLAASLEKRSEHPLAKAVMEYCASIGTEAEEVSDFLALPGNGLTAKLNGETLTGGSLSFIGSKTSISEELKLQAQRLSEDGKTPLLFMKGTELAGIIAVADTIKEDAKEAISQLRAMGIQTIMLTGDNERTAKAIGRQAGVDHVIAGVLPDGKESVIRALQEKGRVAMVGDGINDAPALTRADIGIAIGAGADVAIDAADVVLMKSNLSDVSAAVRLSRATLRNIHENLFWAFFYNVIGIPIAAGVFAQAGIVLNPMIGAAAMSLSSFCVVSNALRLNLLKVNDGSKDRRPGAGDPDITDVIESISKEKNMAETIRMQIEGMMCPHCEARVKKALEAVEGVQEALVSHQEGSAVVNAAGVSKEALAKAVTDAGYEVKGVE